MRLDYKVTAHMSEREYRKVERVARSLRLTPSEVGRAFILNGLANHPDEVVEGEVVVGPQALLGGEG